MELVKLTNFPWLLSNVFDAATGQPFAGSPQTHTLDHKGIKIGFVGLVEPDWIATLGAVDPSTIEHRDMFEAGSRLATALRNEGCAFIVALTHSRLPNDELLAERCPEIDLICGGHDHDYVVKQHGPHSTWVVKSGTDFRALTELRLTFPDTPPPFNRGDVTIRATRHDTLASLPEEPNMKAILNEFLASREKSMAVELGVVEVELDARFSTVRTKESNAGNLVAGCLKKALHGDCCLINGGLLRADRVQGPGSYTVKDLVDLLPMATQAVLLEMPGSLIPSILENSVCKFPVLEGRFGQVSGIRFDFDSDAPPGSRVIHDSIHVARAPLDVNRKYKFVTTAYLAQGKDGYDAFAHPSVRVLVDEENGITVPTTLRNLFRMVNTLSILKQSVSKRSAEDDDISISPDVDGRIHNIRGDPRITERDIAARQIQKIARARSGRMVASRRRLMLKAANSGGAPLESDPLASTTSAADSSSAAGASEEPASPSSRTAPSPLSNPASAKVFPDAKGLKAAEIVAPTKGGCCF
jgi:5'-nucleotidase